MYACGHDTCELCHRRWTVDQGKRSCPVCRAPVGSGAPGEQLPGVCMRLARTVEALFPEVCGVGVWEGWARSVLEGSRSAEPQRWPSPPCRTTPTRLPASCLPPCHSHVQCVNERQAEVGE